MNDETSSFFLLNTKLEDFEKYPNEILITVFENITRGVITTGLYKTMNDVVRAVFLVVIRLDLGLLKPEEVKSESPVPLIQLTVVDKEVTDEQIKDATNRVSTRLRILMAVAINNVYSRSEINNTN